MAAINWPQFNERVVGRGHPSLADTANRALRQVLSDSGIDPDATFGGLVGPIFNVRASSFGALGDGTTDDATAINAAITAAIAAGGGVIYFPAGVYLVNSTVVIPAGTTSSSIILRGQGMRDSYIYPGTNGITAIRFGTATPDVSGTSTSNLSYSGMEDLSVNGSLTDGTGVGVQFTQMQKGWMRNVIIEEFDGAGGIGLYLLGSTGASAPHCWRCGFTNVVVATCKRPLVLFNADENDFYNCNFGCKPGEGSVTYAIEILQGRNSRFFGLLLSGDTSASANYQAMRFNTPGVGSNSGHQVYGLVAEGFDIGVFIQSQTVQNIWIYGYNSSINRAAFNNGSDDGTSSFERRNNVHIYMAASSQLTGVQDHHSGAEPEPETVTLTMNGGGNFTPDVRGSNTFAASANTGGSAITDFLDNGAAAKPGKTITIRLDANIGITHNASLIRCPGATNVTAAAHKLVTLKRLGGLWYVTSVSAD